MQNAFEIYLALGFEHIIDISAYDHILFIIALCAIYQLFEWKKAAILATAFTIGHSVTLALAAFDILTFPSQVIEFLIPVTIFITAIYNVLSKRKLDNNVTKWVNLNYLLALVFGFIHGMGFSNYFKSTQFPGQVNEVVSQLFAFNLGVEIGQLLIITFILATSFIAFNILKIKQREWNLFISGAAAGVAIILMMETKFW
ncbi:MAG: hypothetical protein ACI9XO_000220 [Paraglaciecola sp.]|jgi:hypothetical protein